MKYDLIIVGAGPSGLALAQCLRDRYDKILIIESEAEIGGLHRVIRVPVNNENIFTEHSPRIYSNTYKNFNMLLKDMKSDFENLFTPYNFSISEIGGQTIFSTLSLREIMLIGLQYIALIFNDNHGMDITIGKFITENNFSEGSKDLIDRLTRLTDGAGSDKFTLNQFLAIFNQQFFYKLYQPKQPNDIGLFKLWKDFLVSKGISIQLKSRVTKINYDINTKLVNSVTILDVDKNTYENIYTERLVLALPPSSIVPILSNSQVEVKNAFMRYEKFKKFAINTEYLTYISMTFHWKTKLILPKVYGFPKSEWGLAFIILSDYMTFSENSSKTVITCTITYTDVVSSNINKTANQCTTENEILNEALIQLKLAFPSLPKPTVSLLSPEMSYNFLKNKWETSGNAFIKTSIKPFLPFTSKIENLYNLGTQNGKQFYKFTSLESAVTNSISLSHLLYPKSKKIYKIQYIYTVSEFIKGIFISIIVLILIYKIFSNIK